VRCSDGRSPTACTSPRLQRLRDREEVLGEATLRAAEAADLGISAPTEVHIFRGGLACWLETPVPGQDQEIDEPCMVYVKK